MQNICLYITVSMFFSKVKSLKINVEKPLGWQAEIMPDVINSLEPEKETTVRIQVNVATSIFETLVLIQTSIDLIIGLIWFGIKLSKK